MQKKTASYKIINNPPFSISKATFQKWVGGVQGSGSGTTLEVIFNKLPEEITIKEFYFKHKIVEAIPSNGPKRIYKGSFKNEQRQDIIMDSAPIKESLNTPKKKFPFQLKENQAVVSYTKDGVLYFSKIEDIVEKPLIAYPQSNPNNKK